VPEHIRLFNVAKKMFEQKEYHKAEHLLKRATRLVIDDANIHAWMGWVIMHNPEHDAESQSSDALDSLLYAISIDDKNTDALFFLTQYYRERNQPEQALNPARLLNRLKPSKESKILIEQINEEIKNQSS
jgi:tetratricopeptide (TPR) repeat protein